MEKAKRKVLPGEPSIADGAIPDDRDERLPSDRMSNSQALVIKHNPCLERIQAYTVVMNDKAQDVKCPTCGALPGKSCCRENGSLLSDSHLSRKTLASVEIAKAKKKIAP